MSSPSFSEQHFQKQTSGSPQLHETLVTAQLTQRSDNVTRGSDGTTEGQEEPFPEGALLLDADPGSTDNIGAIERPAGHSDAQVMTPGAQVMTPGAQVMTPGAQSLESTMNASTVALEGRNGAHAVTPMAINSESSTAKTANSTESTAAATKGTSDTKSLPSSNGEITSTQASIENLTSSTVLKDNQQSTRKSHSIIFTTDYADPAKYAKSTLKSGDEPHPETTNNAASTVTNENKEVHSTVLIAESTVPTSIISAQPAGKAETTVASARDAARPTTIKSIVNLAPQVQPPVSGVGNISVQMVDSGSNNVRTAYERPNSSDALQIKAGVCL